MSHYQNKQYFSKVPDYFFVHWINKDTWHTMHYYDMQRFYRFIHALRRFSRKEYSEKEIESIIKKAIIEYHKNFNRKTICDRARELAVIAKHCLDCLSVYIYPYPTSRYK